MKNKKFILIFSMVFLGVLLGTYFFSSNKNSSPAIKVKKEVDKIPEIEQISTDFNLNSFKGKEEIELLKELRICDSTMKEDNNLARPSCSPRFFRFFKLKADKTLNEGFVLLVRSGVNGFPVRRLLIFHREGNKLINTNKFVGYIIEKRKVANNFDDIVIRFFERYQNQKYFYHCLYSWRNGKYQFVRCEEINSERVKPELLDSVSVEVQKILIEKNLDY
jgi:hypothetical protein